VKGIKIILIVLLLCSNIFAKESDSILQFLKISPAPEVCALGNSCVSVSGNANLLYYNPSLTSFFYLKPKPFAYTPDTYSLYAKHKPPLLKAVNISLSYIKYFESLNYGAIFSTFLLKRIGTVGIGIISLFYNEISKTRIDEDNYVLLDKMSIGDYCVIMNYSRKINNEIGAGINLKGIIEKLDDSTGSSVAADIGAIYNRHKWGIGISIQNIGFPVKFDNERFNLPLDFQIGGHYVLNKRKFLINPGDRILFTGMVKKGIETEFITGAGIEYSWREIAYIRIGYQLFGNEDGIKIGTGVKYKNMMLNYCINFHTSLGIVHRIGFSMLIENKRRIPAPDTTDKLFQKSKRGLEVAIPNDILFEYNKAELKIESYKILDRVVKEIRKHPEYMVRIEGNTDNIGSEEYNLILSQKRAYSVYNYLKCAGIEKERMIPIGLGESNPVASNDTEEGRQMNRRVDIVLIKKEGEDFISDLIKELPKFERDNVEVLFYEGLDRYYRLDPKGAIELWKKIRTQNEKLQRLIDEKIEKVKNEIKQGMHKIDVKNENN